MAALSSPASKRAPSSHGDASWWNSADVRAKRDERQPAIGRRCRRLHSIGGADPDGREVAGLLPLASSCSRNEGKTDVLVAPAQLLGGVDDAGAIRQPG
ncbi:MAG: hypothetical protein M3Q37_10465, partial [Gemmatimonadota bacterium]|nr:hypothetical protein [Gemmatimonadota bacterium]